MRPSSASRVLSVVAVLMVVGGLSACGSSGDDETDGANPPATALPTGDVSPTPCWGKGSDTSLPSTNPKAQRYVDLSEQAALDLADERQQPVRIAGRDGECFALTMDYNPDRVNLYIESDQVVAATLG